MAPYSARSRGAAQGALRRELEAQIAVGFLPEHVLMLEKYNRLLGVSLRINDYPVLA